MTPEQEACLPCPICAASILPTVESCPQCGADLRWHALLQTMQAAILQAQTGTAALATQLVELQERFNRFAAWSRRQENPVPLEPAPLLVMPPAKPVSTVPQERPVARFLATGLLFLIILVPMLFVGHWVTMFWTIQATALLWLGVHLQQRWLYVGVVVLHGLTVGKFVFYDYEVIFRLNPATLAYTRNFSHLLVERWGTAAMLLVSLLYSARLLRAVPSSGLWQQRIATGFSGLSAVLLGMVLTIELSAFFAAYARQARLAAISGLWMFLAMVTMLYGFLLQHPLLQQSAFGLFALTIVKIFFVDTAHLSMPVRIVALLVLGGLLSGASYFYYRYRDTLLPNTYDQEAS